MKFRELLEQTSEYTKDTLKNALYSYSLIGSKLADSDEQYVWNLQKQKAIVLNIKKRKPVMAFRTYSLSEKQWFKLFESGYTEVGNINAEHGLVSLTVNEQSLKRFYGGGDVTIILKIKMKKYVEVLEDSAFPEEQELLGYNFKWKVTGINDESRNWYIIGEQI